MMMQKLNYMLEIDIFKNSSQKDLGVLRGAFKCLGVQKDTQTPWLLRPWHEYCRPSKMSLHGE